MRVRHLVGIGLLLGAACSMTMIGCAGLDGRSISERYSDELAQLEPGISIDQFREVLPRSAPRGQSTIDGHVVDAYELRHKHTTHYMGDRQTDILWFYFSDKKLVKWGAPDDWPTPADFTVEWRQGGRTLQAGTP